MIGQYKTFADYLVGEFTEFRQMFPVDTVIFDIDSAHKKLYYPNGIYNPVPELEFSEIAGNTSLPPYNNMFFQWYGSDASAIGEGWLPDSIGGALLGRVDEDVWEMLSFSLFKDGALFYCRSSHWIRFDEGCFSSSGIAQQTGFADIEARNAAIGGAIKEIADYEKSQGRKLSDFEIQRLTYKFPYIMPDEMYEYYVAFVVYALSLIHQRCDIELITPQLTRGDKRRAQKAGQAIKEPSPYFLLKVDPTKPRKVYEPSGHHTGQKNRAHIVRGHFRHVDDHPLPQFNGTFWIPAHMRGDKNKGIVNKGYRIVLPDNDREAS